MVNPLLVAELRALGKTKAQRPRSGCKGCPTKIEQFSLRSWEDLTVFLKSTHVFFWIDIVTPETEREKVKLTSILGLELPRLGELSKVHP